MSIQTLFQLRPPVYLQLFAFYNNNLQIYPPPLLHQPSPPFLPPTNYPPPSPSRPVQYKKKVLSISAFFLFLSGVVFSKSLLLFSRRHLRSVLRHSKVPNLFFCGVRQLSFSVTLPHGSREKRGHLCVLSGGFGGGGLSFPTEDNQNHDRKIRFLRSFWNV